MDDMDVDACDYQVVRQGHMPIPPTSVVVSTDCSDRGDTTELFQDFGKTDVTCMDDEVAPAQGFHGLRT